MGGHYLAAFLLVGEGDSPELRATREIETAEILTYGWF